MNPDFAAARAANDAALEAARIGKATHARVERAIVRAEKRCGVLAARRRKRLERMRADRAKEKLARQLIGSIAESANA